MRAVEIAKRLCPRAHPNYIRALENGDAEMEAAGITTPLRLAHFLAQVLHETGGLTILEENMRYTAARIRQVWPSRPEAVQFAGNPEGLANSVYANRMNNGPPSSGDGWRFRGRGFLQTTGRYSYEKFGFSKQPDLIAHDPIFMLRPALMEWQAGLCNEKADRNAIKEITQRINGGLIGFDDRVRWFDRIWKLIGEAPSWQTAAPDVDLMSVQKRLNFVGIPVTVDGRKGPATVAAIKAFQKSAGIPVDGVAGPVTRAALDARIAEAQEGKAPKPDTAEEPVVDPALAAKSGGAATLLGGLGDTAIDQANQLQGFAAYVPILKYVVAALIIVGVAAMLYGFIQPHLKRRPGAPS